MNYQETLSFLYEQLPMFQRIGAAAMKKDLGNIRLLCQALDNPHEKFRSVHIAGTNGKGSVAHMLAAVMQASGRKTGLYTSPHLKDFRERIKIDGQMITEVKVVDFVQRLMPVIQEVQPSFFEITVAMAFDYFRSEQVDIAIIETGLGGRLDSTNIITPLLSIITNIGFDHQQFLGDTLELIAGEKAGIIKPNIPVIIGQRQEETTPVFKQVAAQNQSPLHFAEDAFQLEFDSGPGDLEKIIAIYPTPFYLPEDITLDLLGDYQIHNATTVLTAIKILRELDWEFNVAAIGNAFAKCKTLTNFRGRFDVLQEQPFTVADCAHNDAGLIPVLKQLERIGKPKWHFVWGMVNDKDVSKILAMLPKNATYYFAKPDIPRGMDAHDLLDKAAAYGLQGMVYGSVQEAYIAAQAAASEADGIYVGGSTFVVAEVV